MKKLLFIILLLLNAWVAPASAQSCNPNIPLSAPDSRFVINTDETLEDTQTGLIWSRCALGQSGNTCAGTASSYTWQGALDAAEASGHAGQSDWRLPNLKELASIVEMACWSPAINTTVFPNTPSSFFWSASPSAYHSSGAWFVHFNGGYDAYGYRSDDNHVRLVRGGQ